MKKEKLQIDTIKKDVLTALEKSKGIVSHACRIAKISRQTFYNYCNTDEVFKQAVIDITDNQIDFVESKLLQAIDKDDTTAMIFYLKTKARHRGYGDKPVIHALPNYQLEKIIYELKSETNE